VTQHVDVGDRLTTVGEHHRHVDQYPAPVMDRDERRRGQRLRQLRGQSSPVSEQPHRDRPSVRHHTRSISGD